MRRIETFVATDGRDAGKHYVIEEFDAWRTEEMVTRGFMSLAHNGQDMRQFVSAGAAAVSQLGLGVFSMMAYHDARP